MISYKILVNINSYFPDPKVGTEINFNNQTQRWNRKEKTLTHLLLFVPFTFLSLISEHTSSLPLTQIVNGQIK